MTLVPMVILSLTPLYLLHTLHFSKTFLKPIYKKLGFHIVSSYSQPPLLPPALPYFQPLPNSGCHRHRPSSPSNNHSHAITTPPSLPILGIHALFIHHQLSSYTTSLATTPWLSHHIEGFFF